MGGCTLPLHGFLGHRLKPCTFFVHLCHTYATALGSESLKSHRLGVKGNKRNKEVKEHDSAIQFCQPDNAVPGKILLRPSRLNPVYLLIRLTFLDLRFRSGSCFSAGMLIHGASTMGQ